MLQIGLVTWKYDAVQNNKRRIMSALINMRLDICSSVFLKNPYNVFADDLLCTPASDKKVERNKNSVIDTVYLGYVLRKLKFLQILQITFEIKVDHFHSNYDIFHGLYFDQPHNDQETAKENSQNKYKHLSKE